MDRFAAYNPKTRRQEINRDNYTYIKNKLVWVCAVKGCNGQIKFTTDGHDVEFDPESVHSCRGNQRQGMLILWKVIKFWGEEF
jgi:hypothetical protein